MTEQCSISDRGSCACTSGAPMANAAVAYGVACVANALLTIFKESIPAIKSALAQVGHHWIGHGVVVLALFFVVWLIAARMNLAEKQSIGEACAARLVWRGTLIGMAMIGVFYLVH